MIILNIHTDTGIEEWKLPEDIKKYQKVRFEILSRYPVTFKVEMTENGKLLDTCTIEDIFTI